MTKNIYIRENALGLVVYNNRKPVFGNLDGQIVKEYAIALGKAEKKNVYFDGDWKEILYKVN